MLNPKTPILGRLENSRGGWIRTNDLRVMSHHLAKQTFDRKAAIFALPASRWYPGTLRDVIWISMTRL